MSTASSPNVAPRSRSRSVTPASSAASAAASQASSRCEVCGQPGRRQRALEQSVDGVVAEVEPAERVVGRRVPGPPYGDQVADPFLQHAEAPEHVRQARRGHRDPRRRAGAIGCGCGSSTGGGTCW